MRPVRPSRSIIPSGAAALLLAALHLAEIRGQTAGGAAAKSPAPAPQKAPAPRDRSILIEGAGAPLQVYQVPEASGKDFSDAHAYIICDRASGEALIVDAGARSAPLALRRTASLGLRVALIASTHFHADHTGGNSLVLSKTAAKMVASAREAPLITGEGLTPSEKKQMVANATPRVDLKVKQGDELKLGDHAIKVIEIPGHSPGGICLYFPAEKLLFTGDSLVSGGIGRLGIPYASKTPEGIVSGIRSKLLSLPDDTRVLPGHGPLTSIGAERASNPWLRPPAKEEKPAGEKKKR